MTSLLVGLAVSAGTAAYTARQNKKAAETQSAAIAGAPRAELEAQRDILPDLYNIELEYGEKFQQLDLDGQKRSADQMAQTLLEIQQKYGSEYVQESLKQLQEADPEGFAARKQLYQRITDQIAKDDARGPDAMAEGLRTAFMEELSVDAKRDTSASKSVQDTVLKEYGLGAQLDEGTRREVEQSVRRGQVARGQTRGSAALTEEAMTTGMAGEARKQQRLANLMGYLTSGATVDDQLAAGRTENTNRLTALQNYLGSGTTPDDIAFRREQQNLGNLSAFMSGQTPTAQFSQLSGANNLAAPQMPQSPGRVLNPNALSVGAGNAAGMNANLLANQSNPWMTGLGLTMQGFGVAGKLGYQPFGN